jgi:carboxymethylenebutenolidase
MSETVRLKAGDGHELDAYVSSPSDEPIAGLVVIQEAFGVNRHIRSVTDSYAKDGFLTVAPSFFDRIERRRTGL